MDIILSFDTEDFVTPRANEAQLWWAETLSERSIRGSFQMVGELIRVLQANGRQDVIDALAKHEIGNHTDYHSVPPTHPQAVSGKSLSEGVAWVRENEAASFLAIEEAFNRTPISYCSPGDSWTPATLIAMAEKGVKVFCDSRISHPSKKPYWYCGLLNTNYNLSIEQCFVSGDVSIEDMFTQIDNDLQSMPDDGVYIMYTHPTRLVTTGFWDKTFYNAAELPRDKWESAPLYSDTDIEENKRRVNQFLDFLQEKESIRFIDYETMWRERKDSERSLGDLLAQQGLVAQDYDALLKDTKGDYLDLALINAFKYGWGPLPENFKGDDLIAQAARLAWTTAEANK